MRALLIAAALALSACGLTAPPDSVGSAPAASVVDKAMVEATRDLIHANDAYTVVATATAAAARSGVIPASAAPRLRQINTDINLWLDRGYAAQTVADRVWATKMVTGLTAQLSALAGAH